MYSSYICDGLLLQFGKNAQHVLSDD